MRRSFASGGAIDKRSRSGAGSATVAEFLRLNLSGLALVEA
jgi:hypothetical protein